MTKDWSNLRNSNQNQTYWHRTFRATITKESLLQKYEELGQWKKVAEHFHVSHNYVIQARKWLGIFVRTFTSGKNYSGENCKSYKGGKWKDKQGYVVYSANHPENHTGRVCYEHILVIERDIKRPIALGEVVHHLDGDKSNNHLSNLLLCNHSRHRKLERQLYFIAMGLVRQGLISYNSDEDRYELTEMFKHMKEDQ